MVFTEPLVSDTLFSEPLRSGSPHGHALFVLADDMKSKIEVMQEKRQFKDLPNNTCLNGSGAENQVQIDEVKVSTLPW